MDVNHPSQVLVVIDEGIDTSETWDRAVSESTAVCRLRPDHDPIAQITTALVAHPSVKTLHLLCHGEPGVLKLGTATLDLTSLKTYAHDLRQWWQTTELSTLVLYGCEVARGSIGRAFIQGVRELTGAAIAASTTPIGATALGGNWELDYRIGDPTWQSPLTPETLQTYAGIFGAPSIDDTFEGTRTVVEDGTLTFSDITIRDTGPEDGNPAETQVVTVAIATGTLTLTNTTGLANVVGNGSTSLSFEGSVSAINAAIAGLQYTPNQNISGGFTLAMTTSDGINPTASINIPFAVTAVNDDSALSPTSAAVDEGGNVTFADSNFGLTDVDNLPEQIIIKISALPTKGSLRHDGAPVVIVSTFSSDTVGQLVYFHDGTQTTVSGGTSDSFAVTVEDGAGGFVSSTAIPITINPVNQSPAITGEEEVFEGEPDHPVTITIVDPDQTDPFSVEIRSLPIDGILKVNGVNATIGQVLTGADLSNVTYSHDGNDDNNGLPPDDSFDVRLIDDGGGTGTPAIVDTAVPIRIIPNNDDPTLAVNAGVTLSSATGRRVTITNALLQVTDPDSTDAQLTYTVTQLPTQGLVLRGGVRLVVGSTFTQADIDAGLLEYLFSESASASGTTDSFTFTVRDAELRNWPSLREGGIYADDNQSTPLSEIPFSITVDPTTPSGPGLGGGGGGGGGDTATFPADSLDAPPTGDINGGSGITNLGIVLDESGTATITNAELTVTDTDSTDDQIIYRLMSVPTGGTLKLGDNVLRIYDSFSQSDVNNNRLSFEHGDGEVFNDRFTFTLSDGKNVSTNNGNSFEFEIDVDPINDRPLAQVSANPFVQEGNTVTIDGTFLTLGDIDGSGQQPDHLTSPHFADPNTLTFTVTELPQFGTLLLNGSAIATSTVMTKADLDNGNLVYEHAGNEDFADAFKVQVNDNTGEANQLSAEQTVNIDIAKLNDDPQFSSQANLKVAEGDSGVIKGANYTGLEPHLIYTDPDNTTIQRQYRITTAVQYGRLTRNGTVLGVGSVFTQDDLDSDRIQYEHDGSENFSDFFEFGVRDGGGAVVPGVYTIDVDPPVNDAPELTVPTATQTFDTLTAFEFSTAQSNAITIDDPDLLNVDAGEIDLIRVTLDLQTGGSTYTASTLTLADTTGLTVTTGTSGSSGGILTVEGALADVQAALDGLTVQVPTDEDRTLDLVVTVDDRRDPLSPSANPLLANNGGRDPVGAPAGYNLVTKTVQINTSNVNDPPTVSVPATATVDEDGYLYFDGNSGTGFSSLISIADPDAFSADVEVTLALASSIMGDLDITFDKGTLDTTANPDVYVTTTGDTTNVDYHRIILKGTVANINAALASLTFESGIDFNGTAALTVTVNDLGNTGGTAKTVTDTVTITVDPLNDQPEVTVPVTQTLDDANPLTLAPGSIAIADTPDLAYGSDYGAIDNFTVTVAATQTSNGSPFGDITFAANGSAVVINNGTDTVTITGTLADVNATLDTLSYVPDIGNVDDQIRITITVDDGDNGAEGTSGFGEPTSSSDSFLVNVSDVNEPPVLTSPGNLSVDEDRTLTLTGSDTFSFADPDDFGANNLEATVVATDGTLALVANDGVSVSGSGTNTLVLTGTEAQINNALDGLQFTPTPNFHGIAGNRAELTVTINDKGNTGTGGEQTATEIITIAVTPVNDRPIATGSIALSPGTEDTTPNSAETFDNLVSTNNNYNDTTDNQTANTGDDDETPLSYVAIVGSTDYDTGQGTWQVSSDGTTWLDVPTGSLSETSALVFPKAWQVRFAPAADFHGTPGSLNIRLADSSTAIAASTTASDFQNLSSNGGTGIAGAWSLESVPVGVLNGITSINDAPTIADPTSAAALTSVDEDTVTPAGDTVFNLFNPKYVDTTDDQRAILGGGDDATPLAGIAVTANAADSTTEGRWQYNTGAGWTDVPDIGLSDTAALILAATDQLRFVPVADYNGTPGQLTVRLSDGTNLPTNTTADISGELGNTHGWSADTTALATQVNPVNDAPELDDVPARSLTTLDEDAAAPSNGDIIGELVSDLIPNSTDITDIDAGAIDGIAITDIQNGTLYYSTDNGATWQAASTPTDAAALLLANDGQTRLFFQPDTNVNGTFDALTFRAWDQTSGINGGTADTTTNGGTTAFSIATDAIAITINPINDAPRRSQNNVYLANAPEDTTTPSSSTIAGLLTAAFDDSDDDQTALSGSTPNALAGFAIYSNNTQPDQGTWQWFNTTTSSWQDIGTGLRNNNALILAANTEVRFVPIANFNGRSGRLRGHLIDDSSGAVTSGSFVNLNSTGRGGTTPYSANNNRVSLWSRTTPVNDAPLASGVAVIATVEEDATNPPGELVSSLVTPNFDDDTDEITASTVGNSTADDLAGIAIVNNPTTAAEGTWQYFDGANWLDVGSPTLGSALVVAASDPLRFIPAGNYVGDIPDLTVHLMDDSAGAVTTGTTLDLSIAGATGGITAISAGTVAIDGTVTPVNDAPDLSGTVGASFQEGDTAIGLVSGASVSDIDAPHFNGGSLAIALDNYVTGDTLAIANQGANPGEIGVSGNTITYGGTTLGTLSGGNGSDLTITFTSTTATPAAAQALIEQITFFTNSDDPTVNGTAPTRNVTFTLNDGGNTGSGGPLTDVIAGVIAIAAVNDPPEVVTSAGTTSFVEANNMASTPVAIDPALTVDDIDSATLASGLVAITGNHELTEDILAFTNDNGTLYGNITVASFDSTAGELSLISAGGTATPAQWQNALRAVTYTNTSDTPNPANRTVSFQVNDGGLDSLIATKALAIAPTNDDPTATDNTAAVTEESPLTDSGNLLTDDDTSNGIDSDPDGNPLSISQIQVGSTTVTNPNTDVTGDYGSLNWDSNGSYTYTLNNANPAIQALDDGETLTETFTYTVDDGNGGTDTATLVITINGQNDSPELDTPIADQANPDDTNLSLSPVDISGNFSDPDTNGILTFTATGLPPGLSLDLNSGEITGTIDNAASQGGPGNDGVYTVIVTAEDNNNATITDTFTWTVTNPGPTATNNTAIATEDSSLTDSGNLLTDNDNSNGTDSDPDSDPLSVSQIQFGGSTVTNPSVDISGDYGSLDWDSNGNYTYTLSNTNSAIQALDDGETLTETFTYTVDDGNGGTDTATLVITINGQNDSPELDTPIANQTNPDNTNLTLSPVDISDSFSDPDTTDTLTFDLTGLPPGLTFDPNTGVITGTIDQDASQGGASGVYTVTVTAQDDNNVIVTDTFTWTVTNPGPTATDNTAIATEDSALTDSGNLLTDDDNSNGTDSDPDGDPLSVSQLQFGGNTVTNPSADISGDYGSLNWDSNGDYTYTLSNTNPAVQALDDGETLTETFTYTLSDREGGTDTATLVVTIAGQNDTPEPVGTIPNQNNPDNATITPVDIAGNFRDPDANDTLEFTATGLPTGLTLDRTSGEITGTIDNSASQGGPNPGTPGVYPITITAIDDNGTTTTQTFVWTITNPGLTATDNAATVNEDGPLSDSGNVINDDDGNGQDVDLDGDPITVTAITTGSVVADPTVDSVGTYGSLNWETDGSYIYTLDNTIPAVQALDDGETLTDTFVYSISDGEGSTGAAELMVTITGTNDAPELDRAIADQTHPDSTHFSGSPVNIASSFSDPDTNDSLTFTAVGLPTGLTLDPNSGDIIGTINSSASQGGPGNDGIFTVTVTAQDDNTATVTDTFTWTVTNPAPTATHNTAAVTEDGVSTDSGNLIAEDDGNGVDSDLDGDTLRVSQIQFGGITETDASNAIAGNYGRLDWDANGGYTYTLDNANLVVQGLDDGETLTETFAYTVDDGNGGTDMATLVVTITGQNDGPDLDSAIADQSNLDADPINLNVGNNFIDVDTSDDLTFDISGLPPGLTFDADTGEISGILDIDASQGGPNGVYAITVIARDNNTVPISDTFNWTVTNPTPVATDNTAIVTEDDALTDSGDLLIDDDGDSVDRDDDGDGLTISQIQQGATVITDPAQNLIGTYGTLDWDTAGGYTYTLDNANPGVQALDDGENLTDVFTYTLRDGDGDTDTSRLTVTVVGVNDAPISTPLDNQDHPDSTVIPGLDLSGNFTDPDISDTLDFTATGLPSGLFIDATSGIISGTITSNASQGGPSSNGLYTVTITATDDNGASTNQSFIWTINNPGLIATNNTANVSEETLLSDSGNLLTDDDGNGVDIDLDGDPLAVIAIAHNGITSSNPAQASNGTYGSLTWNSNGTYTYTLDNANPIVQALNDGETLTDQFTYSVSDGQGSISAAQLIVTITGQTDNSGWNGSNGDDIVTGVDPNGGISGLSDPDIFYGYAGNDILNGGSDIDLVDGGANNDVINGGSGPDFLLGQAGRDVLNGGSGPDFLDGGDGDALLMGSNGDDVMVGGHGNDMMNGGRDNDRLFGGAGRDTLTGGQGDDIFQFTALSDGTDTIVDFEIVRDRLQFSGFTGLSFEALQLQQVGDDTLISVPNGNTLTPMAWLRDVNAATLSADHAIFDAGTGITPPIIPLSLELTEADDYLASNPDLIAAFGYDLAAAQTHYAQSGYHESRNLDTFAEDIYLASHTDLIAAFGYDLEAATRHYIQRGHSEGRTANGFIPAYYLNAYEDLKAEFGNDLAAATRHYIEHGYREGRDLLGDFDGAAYVASHQDLIQSLGNNSNAGRSHFLQFGHAEGRTITFEGDDYIASHGDLIPVFQTDFAAGIAHYISSGMGEGRATDTFDEVAYLNHYADLQAAFGNDTAAATVHFIQFGFLEGRTA
jgi:VCBS repeat-containing protein